MQSEDYGYEVDPAVLKDWLADPLRRLRSLLESSSSLPAGSPALWQHAGAQEASLSDALQSVTDIAGPHIHDSTCLSYLAAEGTLPGAAILYLRRLTEKGPSRPGNQAGATQTAPASEAECQAMTHVFDFLDGLLTGYPPSQMQQGMWDFIAALCHAQPFRVIVAAMRIDQQSDPYADEDDDADPPEAVVLMYISSLACAASAAYVASVLVKFEAVSRPVRELMQGAMDAVGFFAHTCAVTGGGLALCRDTHLTQATGHAAEHLLAGITTMVAVAPPAGGPAGLHATARFCREPSAARFLLQLMAHISVPPSAPTSDVQHSIQVRNSATLALNLWLAQNLPGDRGTVAAGSTPRMLELQLSGADVVCAVPCSASRRQCSFDVLAQACTLACTLLTALPCAEECYRAFSAAASLVDVAFDMALATADPQAAALLPAQAEHFPTATQPAAGSVKYCQQALACSHLLGHARSLMSITHTSALAFVPKHQDPGSKEMARFATRVRWYLKSGVYSKLERMRRTGLARLGPLGSCKTGLALDMDVTRDLLVLLDEPQSGPAALQAYASMLAKLRKMGTPASDPPQAATSFTATTPSAPAAGVRHAFSSALPSSNAADPIPAASTSRACLDLPTARAATHSSPAASVNNNASPLQLTSSFTASETAFILVRCLRKTLECTTAAGGLQPPAGLLCTVSATSDTALALKLMVLQLMPLVARCSLTQRLPAFQLIVHRLHQLLDEGYADVTAAAGAPRQVLAMLVAAEAPGGAHRDLLYAALVALGVLLKGSYSGAWQHHAAMLGLVPALVRCFSLLGLDVSQAQQQQPERAGRVAQLMTNAQVQAWQPAVTLSSSCAELVAWQQEAVAGMAALRHRVKMFPSKGVHVKVRTWDDHMLEMLAPSSLLAQVTAASAASTARRPRPTTLVSPVSSSRLDEARKRLFGCCYWRCTNLSGQTEADLQLFRCAGCRLARYCSSICQRKAWRLGHRAACQDWQQAVMETGGPCVQQCV